LLCFEKNAWSSQDHWRRDMRAEVNSNYCLLFIYRLQMADFSDMLYVKSVYVLAQRSSRFPYSSRWWGRSRRAPRQPVGGGPHQKQRTEGTTTAFRSHLLKAFRVSANCVRILPLFHGGPGSLLVQTTGHVLAQRCSAPCRIAVHGRTVWRSASAEGGQ
jgi:hypothetical protein